MKMNDRKRIVFAQSRQLWRAFTYVMQVHENHYTKRAGVAGLRARGFRVNRGFGASMLGGHGHFWAGRVRLRRGEALRFVVSCEVAKSQDRSARR